MHEVLALLLLLLPTMLIRFVCARARECVGWTDVIQG